MTEVDLKQLKTVNQVIDGMFGMQSTLTTFKNDLRDIRVALRNKNAEIMHLKAELRAKTEIIESMVRADGSG